MQKQTFILFWQTASTYRLRVFSTIFVTIVGTLVTAFAAPLIIAQLLNNIQNGLTSFEANMTLIVIYGIVQIYTQVINMRVTVYLLWALSARSQNDLTKRIFSKLSAQSMSFHADRFGGALVSQTTKMVGAYDRFLDLIIFNIIPTIITIVGTAIILAFIVWQYALVLFVLSIIFVLLVLHGSKFLAKLNKEQTQANTAVNAHISDSITNISMIKAYGKEKEEQLALEEKTKLALDKSLQNMRGFLGVTSIYSSVTASLNIIAIIVAVYIASSTAVEIGLIYLCLTYTLSVTRNLWDINRTMRDYYRIVGDSHDMTEILGLKPLVADKSTKKIQVQMGSVDFKGVTFAHQNNATELFSDFSLHIKSGERVGLVGSSGSGKTTLARLILRFSDIEKGSINIDGQNIADVSQESLRKNIAYVPQEPMLFHRSLRENIAYGRPDASNAEIMDAVEKSNSSDFIASLPNGIDTIVGERGVKLSGGQRQRVAIARAILKDAPILILDEATSALDSQSEKLIQDALVKLMKGRTSIVIAHRLSTIAKLDRIIVLEGGVITEDGSHAELLAKNGTYANLWSHQSGGFIED